ncbi:FtsW/RodA/SpoVE family cell cycle protein [Paenibacillus sp. AR247]|uniref:FtsW/RodA/SpoVE family cell cycle protein n=1 Tax=Paenibacillus sp. AR247 TaxID=1631599 RepID=UPI000CF95B36|nr:FtsW/RodA/SpoVE family cell cycle protein [Paenibacillus sp. AR247]PQP86860.1 cell division protein [Paenibacillus sp. AR247]
MRAVEKDAAVQEFLDRVCRHIRVKSMHAEIREELGNHIAERMDMLASEGVAEEHCAQEAIKLMGDPDDIGRSLHRAHKPVFDWKLVVLLGLLTIVGLFGLLNVQMSGRRIWMLAQFFEKKLFYVALGFAGLFICYFLDYRKLRKYSGVIFCGTIALMALTLKVGITTNGQTTSLAIGSFSINVMAASILPLLIAASGLNYKFRRSDIVGWIKFGGQMAVPVVLYWQSGSLLYGCIYLAGFGIIALRHNQFPLMAIGLPILSLYIYKLTQTPYLVERLHSFLSEKDKDYQTLQTIGAIRSAGWTGHGFAAANETLPFIYDESMYPYLIYCFGWGAGIVIGLLVIGFMIRIWKMSVSIRDEYATCIFSAFIVVFGIRLLWPLLMAYGVVPIVGQSLPFVGYGGFTQVIDFCAMGLLLSIYRRKQMLPARMETV